MKKARGTTQSSFGKAVIESLTEFIEAAQRGEPMTARTVKVELQRREYAPHDIKALRKSLNVSQAVFAKLVGVSLKLVQAWESGANKPSELACNLLDEIGADPAGWLHRRLARQTSRSKARGMRQKHLV